MIGQIEHQNVHIGKLIVSVLNLPLPDLTLSSIYLSIFITPPYIFKSKTKSSLQNNATTLPSCPLDQLF